MPELPEVETYVRNFRPLLEGRRIVRFTSLWPKHAEPSLSAVRRGIVGKRITKLERRAKYIVATLSPGDAQEYKVHKFNADAEHLLIHLRMTGRLEWSGCRENPPLHLRASFELDDGRILWFADSRKFGRITYTRDLAAATAHLGFEPLDRSFTAAALGRLLCGCSRQLKPLLLDQSLIAGLGNIYADEALFSARLHPLLRSANLEEEEIHRLWRAIRTVLSKAIRLGGTSFDWVYPEGGMEKHLNVYGRTGEPCKRCHTPIEYQRIAQRGTHICPCCQRYRGG